MTRTEVQCLHQESKFLLTVRETQPKTDQTIHVEVSMDATATAMEQPT